VAKTGILSVAVTKPKTAEILRIFSCYYMAKSRVFLTQFFYGKLMGLMLSEPLLATPLIHWLAS